MTSVSIHSTPASLGHPGTNEPLAALALHRVRSSPAPQHPISEVRHDATSSHLRPTETLPRATTQQTSPLSFFKRDVEAI